MYGRSVHLIVLILYLQCQGSSIEISIVLTQRHVKTGSHTKSLIKGKSGKDHGLLDPMHSPYSF